MFAPTSERLQELPDEFFWMVKGTFGQIEKHQIAKNTYFEFSRAQA